MSEQTMSSADLAEVSRRIADAEAALRKAHSVIEASRATIRKLNAAWTAARAENVRLSKEVAALRSTFIARREGRAQRRPLRRVSR